ncbi:MAG TPA: type 4a pilus biogenesis protein PilO [Phycisphaerae bacterium]|nr:type 4a pilus biogenesis protein PilO [Phycisphaerae bacterium]
MNERTAPRWEPHSLIWAAAILAGSAAFFLIVARPQTARARELRQTIQNQQVELAARFHSLKEIARIEKEVESLTAQTTHFERRIPREPMLGGFLEELARMAQQQALQSEAIQPGEPVRCGEVFALPIALKVRGPFAKVHALLRNIEQIPRLTRIDRFISVADEEHPGNVIVELDLKVFYQAIEQGGQSG